MRSKRIIKLINNERVNYKLMSAKACTEDVSTNDCSVFDNAQCAVNSYDVCNKDLAGCYNHGYDYCSTPYDTDACINSHDYN